MRARAGALLCLVLPLLPSGAGAQGALSRVFPNGGRQGTTVAVTFAGQNVPDRAELVVDGEGIRGDGPFEKGAGRLIIAPDAAPGPRLLRLVGAKAATSPRPFAVGILPEAEEKEPNDAPATAQRVAELPVTLNGSLPTRPDLDLFRVSLRKGECLVIAGEARSLGAPTNLLVRVRDAEGRELVTQMDHRTRDPLVGFTAPADGEYLVEIQDVMNNYSGINADYVYRLTLTRGPWIDSVFPAGARRGSTAAISFSGWNLGGARGPSRLRADVAIPADAPAVVPVTAGGAPNRVDLVVGDTPEIEEAGAPPGAADAAPAAIAAPVTVNGLFETRGDLDRYRFTARAGERLQLDVAARGIGSFADPVLTLLDAAGKQLAYIDDAEGGRDPRLLWTAPAAGEYDIVLRDLAYLSRGGPGFFYRLRVAPPAPGLRLSTPAPTIIVAPGAKVEVPVTVTRSYLAAPVEVSVRGLPPGVTATTASAAPSPNGTASQEVKLVLSAAPAAAAGYAAATIQGSAGGASPAAEASAAWVLSTDRSGTLARGETRRLLVLVPAP